VILDTNAVSALFDGDDQLGAQLRDAAAIHLPVIVVGEYRYGLERSRHREKLDLLLDALVGETVVLSIDLATASVYARLREDLRRRGRPLPENDVWIAALARQHELPVVSRDTHFDLVPGLKRIGW
jgi:predicted nucleic acid-binding protein